MHLWQCCVIDAAAGAGATSEFISPPARMPLPLLACTVAVIRNGWCDADEKAASLRLVLCCTPLQRRSDAAPQVEQAVEQRVRRQRYRKETLRQCAQGMHTDRVDQHIPHMARGDNSCRRSHDKHCSSSEQGSMLRKG